MGATDLTPYSPRLLLQWEEQEPATKHRAMEGTLVFADVSGFTRLSERFARTSGKAGAEEMGSVVDTLFDELLGVASNRGGEMLKYGGDAALLFFRGDDHAARAAAGSHEMLGRLRDVGRIETRAGPVRLRASIGMNSGTFDLFKVGRRHQELVIAGPATSVTARMEAAADAGEVLVSPSTAALLDERCVGVEKAGGLLLRRKPEAASVAFVPRSPSPHAAKFVSANLGDHLVVDDRPDHRLATVAFVHMMGIDGLLATAGPAAVADMLDDTLTAVMVALDDLGVTLLMTDLADDGAKVMAAAGAPLAGEDEERRMLLALRRMIDAGTPLRLRAGVNRGHVFAASVGPPYRRTFTTIGDVTNTAARLCAKAGSGEVFALRSVLDHARGRFAAVELPPFAAKNKSEPLVPFRVDGVAEDTDNASIGPRFPFLGRQAELDRLVGAARAAHEGSGAVLELVGEVGSGKTRLIDELLGSLGDDVATVIVHCEPYERATPFHPVRGLLTRVLAGEDVEHAVARVAPQLTPWLPLLGGVLDRTIPDTDETRDLDERYRLTRTAAVTVELLEALHPQPAVVVVEDTHWGDEASAAVMRQIERRASATPWFVCATRRPEPAAFTPGRDEDSMALHPLTDDDLAALVDAVTAEDPIPPHRRDAIVSRAAGNPLFLTELLAAGSATSDDALPSSIEALMAAQIDRLPAAERALLRRASVLGSRFRIDLLALIVDEPGLERSSPAVISRRVDALLVPDGRRRLRFRHMLVRDVAYGMLPYRDRRALHLQAGEAIESDLGEGAAERAGILSFHFAQARAFDRAWPYARLAGDRAIGKHANFEAVQLLERALAAAKQLPDVAKEELADVWEKVADCRSFLGDTSLSRDALRAARRLSRDRALVIARLCGKEARLAERDANNDALARCIRRGLAAVDDHHDTAAIGERALLEVLYAWFKFNQGRQRDARRWAERALADAERSANRWALAYAYMVLDGVDIALGTADDPRRTREALAIWEELGDLARQAVVLINLGMYSYYQGRWDEAVALYERGREANARVGGVVDAARASFNIAEILVDQGRVDEAEPLLDDVASVFRSVNFEIGLAFIESHRGRMHLHRGDADAAISLFEAARSQFQAAGQVAQVLDLDVRMAESHLHLGNVAAARVLAAEALTRVATAGGTRSEPSIRRVLAFCAAAEGDIAGSWASMDESLHLARKIGATYDVALALDGFAALSLLGGPPLGPDGDAERQMLLTELGVVAPPPAPIAVPDATERARLAAVPAPASSPAS